jgi:hypothetical protein
MHKEGRRHQLGWHAGGERTVKDAAMSQWLMLPGAQTLHTQVD